MRLSELIESRVVTESGRPVGHVHDVRAAWSEGGSPDDAGRPLRVTALVIGRRGLLERLGLLAPSPSTGSERKHARDTVAWERVVRVERGLVVVRDEDSGG